MTGSVRISIVIPTRNRRGVLARTLDGLARQDAAPGAFEVIVADDGSDDGTKDFLAAERERSRFPLRTFSQPHCGPAFARNRALAIAAAPRALLLGDDTVPAPDLVSKHLAPVAGGAAAGIQGYIEWHPDNPVSPVMRFLAPAGPQFYFVGLVDETPVPWTAVLGSNFSAPTSWFRDEPFDESFRDAAFEDTELSYRWARRGWRTVFRAAAVCFHDHAYETIEPFLRRQRSAGRGARYAVGKHPSMIGTAVLQPIAVGLLRAARHGVRTLLHRGEQSDSWDLRTRYAFVRGFLEG